MGYSSRPKCIKSKILLMLEDLRIIFENNNNSSINKEEEDDD